MRELPLGCTIRLWDTCLSEEYGFARFHLYVCAAFLLRWRKEIMREADFQVSGDLAVLTLAFIIYLFFSFVQVSD